ncbi:MAG: thiamine diphosphokinase [Pseudomonadota bacterium]
MAAGIVQSTEIVTLVGGGPLPAGALAAALGLGPRIVAADGGAAAVMAAGHVPDAVIGDFDSLDARVRAAIPPARLHHDPDQETTDFEKALSQITAPLILAVGCTGGRLDHELAAFNALIKHDKGPVLLIGDEDICFALTGPLTLPVGAGTRVSLFPMAEVRCASTGLRWPTDHLTFRPWGRVGTSNAAVDPDITLTPGGPGMLVILPRATLPAVSRALTG